MNARQRVAFLIGLVMLGGVYLFSGITAFANPSTTNLVAPIGLINLALYRPAIADSSCHSSQGPSNAVDGAWGNIYNDKWCSLGNIKFLEVDLGSYRSIQQVVVKHAGVGGENPAWNTKDFTIQVSSNRSTWNTVAIVRGNTANATYHSVYTMGRYVRLNITTPTSNGDRAARIYELEAWGL
jgi:hypothetical protein